MRYPHLESLDEDWNYRKFYYGAEPAARRVDDDPRVDVDSDLLRFASVLVDVTGLGGDPDERADAILHLVAAEASREMRVASVLQPLDVIATLWNCDTDHNFSRRLADRAVALFRGAALVGALRAIAWHLSQSSTRHLRADLVRQARHVLTESGMQAGHSVLLADDAHAHLRLSERVRDGYEETRDALARTGTLLLGAAHAYAIQEPWDPFVQSRMTNERVEHEAALGRIMGDEPPIRIAFDRAVQILQESGRQGQAAFEACLSDLGHERDLEAFFRSRESQGTSRRPELLDPAVTQFIQLEAELGRLV